MTRPILAYRAVVFTLALGYFIYQFFNANWDSFGLQFRFLTIWALTLNLIVATQMLRLSLGRTTKDWNAFVSMSVVVNITVVVQYWRLYFENPANFYDGEAIVWFQEYYLHLLGPLLMWIDAFLILGAFRAFGRSALYVLALSVLYPLWVELLVHPLNTTPTGSVTQGLPYRFLNNMELPQRLIFYAAVTAANAAFLILGWGLSRLISRRSQT